MAPGAKSLYTLRVVDGTWATLISVVPRSAILGRPAKLFLCEGDVDRDHYDGQDDRQDQQLPQETSHLPYGCTVSRSCRA